ncbi:hypothetical protein EDEG_00703 [Edhazardia aedis USNM 41457]|uniref:Phosphatidylinositol N-acetylglucosaminyltransferase n=1 Tax=Edhazardia aedis (strain USNM 41457) TaxID=1003232 RepID=J9A009_EDHAE|nr:hypothetical protein EDEG_00703 [Edhazardia aedis USNM 41457]|eukprot:EJW05238.1 hypothetical protein EDEG_00703 [Edhazardia aedis USNM 41457]
MWKKILYKHQTYDRNYMPDIKKKIKLDKNTIYDVVRFTHCVISIFIFFAVYKLLDRIQDYIYIISVFVVLTFFLRFFGKEKKRIKQYLRISLAIVFWEYLLSGIMMRFTNEIHTDTIYLYFFIMSFGYCIDITKCAILNTKDKIKPIKPLNMTNVCKNNNKVAPIKFNMIKNPVQRFQLKNLCGEQKSIKKNKNQIYKYKNEYLSNKKGIDLKITNKINNDKKFKKNILKQKMAKISKKSIYQKSKFKVFLKILTYKVFSFCRNKKAANHNIIPYLKQKNIVMTKVRNFKIIYILRHSINKKYCLLKIIRVKLSVISSYLSKIIYKLKCNYKNSEQNSVFAKSLNPKISGSYYYLEKKNIPILGITLSVFSVILLSSRLKFTDYTRFLFGFHLIWYVLFPYVRENHDLHKNVSFTMIFVISGFLMCFFADIILCYFYSCITFFILSTSYIFVKFVNSQLSKQE